MTLGTVIYAFGHTTFNSSAINFIYSFFPFLSFPLTLCIAMLGVPIVHAPIVCGVLMQRQHNIVCDSDLFDFVLFFYRIGTSNGYPPCVNIP